MKFAEFVPGKVIKAGPVQIDHDEMLEFAKRYDPQYFHVDEQAAKSSHWNGLIASGWLTCAITMRMACDAALYDSESFGSPGVEKLRWLAPVRAGDSLRLEATVDTVRVSESRPELGIVRWTWRVFNQNQSQVLELEATSLFAL
ncbi:MaoC family dehydratase [Paenalcaligenes niemegkensis]|uniref:MaoC family dehydratase n=1 Tax=Paenalcaligenes niemegkensis TaxID=2895469 RepID=UPI001EE99365|nr:MaoC family dehydratase [Paenalcaligenes niemegkensis]MCQ9617138.1 MaoC family dehydratase [Paenalcaligenes niemegkensis]